MDFAILFIYESEYMSEFFVDFVRFHHFYLLSKQISDRWKEHQWFLKRMRFFVGERKKKQNFPSLLVDVVFVLLSTFVSIIHGDGMGWNEAILYNK